MEETFQLGVMGLKIGENMERKKIFISSTSDDLADIRAEISRFLKEEYGQEIVYYESADFQTREGLHSHDICIDAVKDCDILLLVIKERYGSNYNGLKYPNYKKYNDIPMSITWAEAACAYDNGLYVCTFVHQMTWKERNAYNEQKKKEKLKHKPDNVDKNKIFEFINFIDQQTKNNWFDQFENVVDLKQKIKGRLGFEDRNNAEHYIGIDIGRNSIKYCLIDYSKFIGNNAKEYLLEEPKVENTPKNLSDPILLYKVLAGIINDLTKNNYIKGIGLGLPGQVDPREGRLINAPGLSLAVPIDFVNDLRKHIKKKEIPIKIDNDVRCATRYEWKENPKFKNFICVFVGNGLGSGIVVDGKMLYGYTFTAGEAGHTTIIDTGLCKYSNPTNSISDFLLENAKCNCKRDGCHWELLVCSYGMEIMVKKCNPKEYEKLKSYCQTDLIAEPDYNKYFNKGELTSYAISGAYYAGENSYVKEIVENIFLKYLGIGIANYINIINPEKIFLGGGMIKGFLETNKKKKNGKTAEQILRDYIKSYSLSKPEEVVVITPNLDEEYIASIGAALIFKDESYIF